MNTDQLEYFLAIVKYKSFTKAANEMFISQSSLSKKIKALENELGIELLNRGKSIIELTHAGKEVYDFAQSFFKEYNKLNKSLDQYRAVSETYIRFASIPILSYYGTSSLLAKFSSENLDKKIYFNIIEMNQEYVMQALNNDEVDIALVRDNFNLVLSNYNFINYYEDEFLLVCNKNHELAHKKTLSYEEIEKYPFILMDKTSTLNDIVIKEFERRNLKLNIKNIVSRHNLILEMISKDIGISILPKKLLETSNINNIVSIPFEKPLKNKLILLIKNNKNHTATTKKFWQFCKENIKE
ncbi:MAG: LysR family transcriptional regulator [Miniphocaeibacter sp.]|uniref:LysR family transcriptional regulator n=1 Tax=Miniphocaeibacter sp. TaxID=3100973 RepID=UPI0017E32D14|nr:LysR family transcriptional regulator [Gallicola sp.]